MSPKNKTIIKSNNVQIREPFIIAAEGRPRGVSFVAFTDTECLDCRLTFTYGRMPYIIGYLHLPTSPNSVQVYDLFNNILKPLATDMTPLTVRLIPKMSNKDLSCNWSLTKEKFIVFTEEVGSQLGEEWVKPLLSIAELIGGEHVSLG